MRLADNLFAGVADAGHTGVTAQRAVLPRLNALQNGLAVVQSVLIVADHRLFQPQMAQQPQGHAGILGGDEIRQTEGSRHAGRHIVQIANRRGNQIQSSGQNKNPF